MLSISAVVGGEVFGQETGRVASPIVATRSDLATERAISEGLNAICHDRGRGFHWDGEKCNPISEDARKIMRGDIEHLNQPPLF